MALDMDESETNYFSIFLIRSEKYTEALEMLDQALERHGDVWFLLLNKSIGNYFVGNKKIALKMMAETKKRSPDYFLERLGQIEKEIQNDSYQLPRS